jgi:hypothetical protein
MKNPDTVFIVFRFRHALLASVSLAGIVLTSCSPPPPLELQHRPDWCSIFVPVASTGPGTAFGDVIIRINGVANSGSMDLKIEKAGFLKADIYGPLGISIASVSADTLHGSISFQDSVFSFDLDQAMNVFPLEWGKSLAFYDFLQLIRGKTPAPATEMVCKKQPDSLGKKRNTIYALWKTDSLEMCLEINNKSRKIISAVFYYKKQAMFWQLRLGSFHKGRAHKIQFWKNDENYFSIKYTKVNFNE